MEAYLDNSATTRCLDSVRDIVVKTMMEDYGNPSSRHLRGVEAERYLKTAREQIARTMKVSEKEIFFTSGGTESNNWALIGAAMANKRAGNHIITTAVEHAAVLQPMLYLQELGFDITFLPVDRYGVVEEETLRNALREDTILVSMMYVNNELGSVEPVVQAKAIMQEICPKALLHVDAIQAYGKYRIMPKKAGIDMLSVSGHKIHGPKGSGFLYINEKVKIKPFILGGGQQKGMRSGTDNVPGIAGLGAAAEEAYKDLAEKQMHLRTVKSRFAAGILSMEGAELQGQSRKLFEEWKNGSDMSAQEFTDARLLTDGWEQYGAPHIVSVSFPKVRSEVLLHALEEKGVYISSGSACSSNKKLPVSSVLKEIHVAPELLESTVRFSFSTYTTIEEITYALDQIACIVPMLSRFVRH